MIPHIDFLSAEALLTPPAHTGVDFCLIGHLEGPGQLSIDSADHRGWRGLAPHVKSLC